MWLVVIVGLLGLMKVRSGNWPHRGQEGRRREALRRLGRALTPEWADGSPHRVPTSVVEEPQRPLTANLRRRRIDALPRSGAPLPCRMAPARRARGPTASGGTISAGQENARRARGQRGAGREAKAECPGFVGAPDLVNEDGVMGDERTPGVPTTRRYSPAEKEQAVRLVRQLRKELGTSHGTIQRVPARSVAGSSRYAPGSSRPTSTRVPSPA